MLHDRSSHAVVSELVERQSAAKPKPSCAPKLLQRRTALAPAHRPDNIGAAVGQASPEDDRQNAWKCRVHEGEDSRGKKPRRTKPPAPMAAPPTKQHAGMDPDMLSGRTKLSQPLTGFFGTPRAS